MLEELDRHARSGVSFAFETTLSGSVYVKRIADWRALGYVVKLIFLRLDTAEEAIARVEARVLQGGHDIPENTVRRRYIKGYENFLNIYQPSVNFWQLFDNSGLEPQLINEGANP
jgi:predicted ABC-type ATPase